MRINCIIYESTYSQIDKPYTSATFNVTTNGFQAFEKDINIYF